MAAIPALVWLFVGLFILIASFWFGNKNENLMKFFVFIGAGGLMVLVGIVKMLLKPRGDEVKTAGRYCPKCGAGLSGSGQFCTRCGNRA